MAKKIPKLKKEEKIGSTKKQAVRKIRGELRNVVVWKSKGKTRVRVMEDRRKIKKPPKEISWTEAKEAYRKHRNKMDQDRKKRAKKVYLNVSI